jgi:DNA-binding IclR family transcriptional regulator
MSIGLTGTMKDALDVIVALIGRHGVPPSLELLAAELGCGKSNAQRLVDALHERGAITRSARGLIALGSGGVAVVVPADVAAGLAVYCAAHDERISAVVADALLLHLDALGQEVDSETR